jgi:xanthine dehydrogenase small subunit
MNEPWVITVVILKMINFILNNQEINTDLPSSLVVLDFLRHSQQLIGTKEGCREGGCGACMILVGEWDGEALSYQPVKSCLLALQKISGKHVVTIEGVNNHELNPIQQAIVDEGATQCGYCTPGIVLSLSSFFLNSPLFPEQQAITALDGNICRCRGYQSIKRAARQLCKKFSPFDVNSKIERLKWLVEKQILPAYFLQIPKRLHKFQKPSPQSSNDSSQSSVVVAGGTIYWQKQADLYPKDIVFLSRQPDLSQIRIEQNRLNVGATTTIEAMKNSPIMRAFFPKIDKYFELIASTPIRHRATVGGNIVAASPTGDLTLFFLALGASITLTDGKIQRTLALKDFFKGHKQLDKAPNELLETVSFPVPTQNAFFNFEKVSKRTYFDIANQIINSFR